VGDSTFDESCGEGSGSSSGSTGKGGLDRPLDGFVFAMVVRAGSEGSYTPFAGEGSAYEETPIAIAAVPVHFVPAEAGGAEAPTVAEITCDGSTTRVLTPEVEAQPDGVHVRVTNTSSTDLAIDFGEVGGDNAPIGTHEVVWSFFPGQVRVGCWDPTVEREPSLDASFTVVDPNGYFVPSMLDCGGGEAVSGFVDYVEGATGWTGDPVDIAREHALGLLPPDDVSYAGYPKQQQPQVRVLRNGALIAVFDFSDDGHGGWLMSSYQACADLGIGGVGSPPSPEYPRGWFEWCPQPPFPEPGRDWSDRASQVALRFVEAYTVGDRAALSQLTDASVPPDAEWMIAVSEGATPTVFATDAHGGELVRFGCGPDVDAYTVAVTFDDGTESASADFTLYLVLREDGWKVWGSY
jgi:hypothetical protein